MTACPAPRYVAAFGGKQYHVILRVLDGRVLTRCDILLGRWRLFYAPPDGMGLCAKCAENERKAGTVDKGNEIK